MSIVRPNARRRDYAHVTVEFHNIERWKHVVGFIIDSFEQINNGIRVFPLIDI